MNKKLKIIFTLLSFAIKLRLSKRGKVEMKVEPESQTLEFYKNHMAALTVESVGIIPEGHSIRIERSDTVCDLSVLRLIVDDMGGKMGKVFVVLPWPDCFEVQRLPDCANSKTAYKLLKMKSPGLCSEESMTKIVGKIQEVISAYKKITLEEAFIYDRILYSKIKDDNVISYTYLHRKCCSSKIFKECEYSPTQALKLGIQHLLAVNVLENVTINEGKEKYKTGATLYRIADNAAS